jgi:YspA, cpYpsA-related SLOG family
MKAILVTGSRQWADRNLLFTYLSEAKPDLVIHGKCNSGADRIADDWCDMEPVTACLRWPARWDNGKKAGPERNQLMLDLLQDLRLGGWSVMVYAFPLEDSRGTFDTTRRAKLMNIPVRTVKG